MNQKPPQNAQQRKSVELNYTKAVKEYIVGKIERKGSHTLSETTIKSNSKRGSIDGQAMFNNTVNGGSRRSSKSEKNISELPPPKAIDNFLSNTQKNLKGQDVDVLSNYTNPTEAQQELSEMSMQEVQNNQEQEVSLFPDKHIYEKLSLQLEEENKIYCLRYDPEDVFVAVASQDGCVRILFESKGTIAYTLSDFSEKPLPATCVRWNPDQSTIKHGLLATYAGGKCLLWHATSSQVLSRYEEKGNDINTCDFTPDGKQFVTAGSDSKVRLYDVGKKNHAIFTSGSCPEHKNRVFASKFMDENALLTAGWDQSVLIWDFRTKATQGYIYGPMICGDSLDFKGTNVLTGSWRNDRQLQLWDIRKTNRAIDIPWDNHSDDPSNQSFIYSCQFSKTDSNHILAGSTGTYEMRLFDRQNNNKCIDALTENINKGVFSLDWSNTKSRATYGTSDGRWAFAEVY